MKNLRAVFTFASKALKFHQGERPNKMASGDMEMKALYDEAISVSKNMDTIVL